MKLSEARAKIGLTQKDVAKAAGISRVSYCNIEIGRRKPSVMTAKRIAQALNIPWTEMFADDQSNRNETENEGVKAERGKG